MGRNAAAVAKTVDPALALAAVEVAADLAAKMMSKVSPKREVIIMNVAIYPDSSDKHSSSGSSNDLSLNIEEQKVHVESGFPVQEGMKVNNGLENLCRKAKF